MTEFAAAFAKAQAEFEHPKRESTGQDGHREFKYADLPAHLDAVRPALNSHDIGIVQTLDITPEGEHVVRTKLLHKSGDYVESVSPIPAGLEVKKLGAYITYLRRYHLAAMCCIAGEDDMDAARLDSVAAPKPKATPKKKADDKPPSSDDAKTSKYLAAMAELEARHAAAYAAAGRDADESRQAIQRVRDQFSVKAWKDITAYEVQREAYDKLHDAVRAAEEFAA